MDDSLPAFVVGVGQAGIAAMNSIQELVTENDDEDSFGFLAIDTDGEMLSNAPDQATTIELTANDKFVKEDQGKYPYLTPDMDIKSKGALRQRPVGRYKMDSRGVDDFSDIFQQIYRQIREHARDVDFSFDRNSDSYNIFLVHSLGGGTGSGTYPLLTASISRISQRLGNALGTDIYVAGMGVVPQVQFTMEPINPPGDQLYYPNAYAALNDLSQLLDANQNPKSIPIYSQMFSRGDEGSNVNKRTQGVFEGNDIPVDTTPFDNYWLVGVNEDEITGTAESGRHESYREQINRTMAEAIYSLSRLEQSAENWATDVQGLPELGTVSHSEIRVPHDEVEEYCALQEELAEKQALVATDSDENRRSIQDEISSLETKRERLEDIHRQPQRAVELLEDGPELKNDLRATLESELGGGEQLITNNAGEDVEAVFQQIEANYNIESLLLATHLFKDVLDDPSAAPRVEDHWRELVSELWTGYDMASRTKYGGTSISTLEGKAEQLQNFFDDKLSEYEDELENIDVQMDNFEKAKDIVPASFGFLQSRKQRIEASQSQMRDDRDELLSATNRYERVQSMRDARDTFRRRSREQLDSKISDLRQRVTEKQEEIEKAKRRIGELNRSLDSLRADLTREKTAKRVGVLPINEDKVDELDAERLDELESFDDYVDQSFVSKDRVRTGLTNWVEKAYAWEEQVMDMDLSKVDHPGVTDTRNELWVLFAEENSHYPKDYINTSLQGDQKFSGESQVGYLNDPYSIAFVSYYNDEPVEALTLFQRLDEMAENSDLDTMTGKFNDHRLAFAYPEWYDREIQKAFKIKSEVTLTAPPELDIERVQKPDLDEPEKRNFIKTSGIDSYIWRGSMWDEYQVEEDIGFTGWEEQLPQVTWRALQQATPDPDMKAKWLANQADWEELLEAYKENLLDQEGLDITFESVTRD